MNKDVRIHNVENELSKSCDCSLRRHFSLSRGSSFQRLSVMTNTSTGPLPAQIECVRGIPVMVMMGWLDTTNAPLFSGFQPLIDIYPDRETALNGSSA